MPESVVITLFMLKIVSGYDQEHCPANGVLNCDKAS